jgi:hypothetical protein
LSDDEGSKDQRVNKSMLSGMFSFMNRNQKQDSGETGALSGIYLSDLNLENMDPAVAALYFPNYRAQAPKTDQDEDGESGKGSSVPQSPAPGSSPKMSHIDSDMEQHRKRNGKLRNDPLIHIDLFILQIIIIPNSLPSFRIIFK